MSSRDAVYLYDEHPRHHETIIACYIFEAPSGVPPSCSSPAALRAWMEARLAAAPLFTRRVRFAPLHLDLPVWVPVAEVDLAAHVHLHHVNGDWPALRGAIGTVAASPIDLARPPWELHALTGARFVDGQHPVTAVVLKVHHSAADGMAVRAMESALFASMGTHSEVAGDSGSRNGTRRSAHPLETAARAAAQAPVRAFRFARRLRTTSSDVEDAGTPSRQDCAAAPRRNRPMTPFNAPATGGLVFDVASFPLADAAAARAAAPGATVNDVLLTAVGGALRRHLAVGRTAADDQERQESLAALVPISLRLRDTRSGGSRNLDAGGGSANQLVLGTVDLRTDIAEPAARLAAVTAASAAEKSRWMDPRTRNARSRMDAAPAWLLAIRGWVRSHSSVSATSTVLRNTMVSNLPAPSGESEFDGTLLRTAFGVLPVVDGDRLRHLFTTSTDRITLCVSADDDALAVPADYATLVLEEIDALVAAGRVAQNRVSDPGL
ncbi:wax ester/triacylglycerol synthase domain-containing protein [Tomitella cavernea]|nr:wax ester/triacylglycerol synthase domain-containing protein [Tomitella cavernea]